METIYTHALALCQEWYFLPILTLYSSWTPPPPHWLGRWRLHGSQTDDSNENCGNGSNRKRLKLDAETKQENTCNKIIDDNKWEKGQQELGLPSAMVVDGYLQKLRSRSNIEKGIFEKFCIELSNSKIEEDLIIMTGYPPRRKQIKRPNVVQNRLKVSILMFSCNHPWF